MNTYENVLWIKKEFEKCIANLKENEAMYLNQIYYLSPVGNEKSNSFEVFPLYSSKIILYPKGSQVYFRKSIERRSTKFSYKFFAVSFNGLIWNFVCKTDK